MFPLFSIDEWWQALSTAQHIFWVIALLFSMLFAILFGLSLLGIGSDADVHADVDTGTGHDFHVDKEFSAFSIRSIIAFCTFFGWTGVFLLSEGRGIIFTTLVSFLSGSAAMFVVAYMIYKFAQLEQSGTVDIQNALDTTGEVYLSIPPERGGRGKIHIVVDGSLHEYEAETKSQALLTGSQVRVVEVLDNEILLVEPVALEAERNS